MTPDDPAPNTMEDLERRVARLERLVAVLAEKLQVRTDNPNDRRSVTTKVTYDWQGTR